MKANDNIPAGEMLLARAVAGARSRGLGWTDFYMFRNATDDPLLADTRRIPKGAAKCCAYGALKIVGAAPRRYLERPISLHNVAEGNDCGETWSSGDDLGESLGWAYRCAMTQEEP